MKSRGRIIHPLLGPFTIVDKLGEGAFARIYLAVHDEYSTPVCLKIYKEGEDIDQNMITTMATAEYEMATSVTHPLVAEAYDVWEYKGRKILMMEYVEGQCLLNYANNCGPLQEGELRTLFAEMLLAVESIHHQKVIHRDLKCENILIDPYGNIRIIDFGFARALGSSHSMARTVCGSPAYVAPEVIMAKPYDYKADIWSLGVILYAISVGSLPFDDSNISRQITRIMKQDPVFPPEMSDSLKDLLQGMLRKDPETRLSMSEIKRHPWMTTDCVGRQFYLSNQNLVICERKFFADLNLGILALMKFAGNSTALADQVRTCERTRDSLLYRIIRKRAVIDELTHLRQNIFQSVPTLRMKPSSTFLHKSRDTLPLLPGLEGATDKQNVRILNLGHDSPAVLLPMRRRSTVVTSIRNQPLFRSSPIDRHLRKC